MFYLSMLAHVSGRRERISFVSLVFFFILVRCIVFLPLNSIAGCVLVELLTASPLFPGRTEYDELHLIAGKI